MQSTWLTQTKFVPPRLRDDVVLRGRLVDALRTAVNSRPLTLLSAPAGYGKTTLLTSLTDIPLAWVSIDEEDNDPARFFITLLNALQKLDSNFGEGIQSLLSSLENPAGNHAVSSGPSSMRHWKSSPKPCWSSMISISFRSQPFTRHWIIYSNTCRPRCT